MYYCYSLSLKLPCGEEINCEIKDTELSKFGKIIF